MRHLAAPLAFSLLASAAVAQDGTGTITGTLNLAPARWIVASAGDGPTSLWTETESGAEIRLVGTPEPESDGGRGTLTIEIEVLSGAIEARATDVRVELQGRDETLVAETPNIDLTLEAYQPSGEDLVLAGSLFANLTPDPTGELIIDSDESVTFDGNFQATIPGAAAD